MIETVFLDAGGVLVFPNWTRVSDALARQGVAVSADALAAADPHARRKLDQSGTINATNDAGRGGSISTWCSAAPRRTDAALAELHEYHTTTNLWEFLPAAVVPALRALRAAGHKIVVVSNANGTLHAKFRSARADGTHGRHPRPCDFGVEKPDPRLFRIAMEQSGASPETTVHVGDLYHVDVLGTRAAGLRAVLFDEAAA